jgi:hypothetical protein
MKTAVLICGEYREFDKAVKSWKFLHQLDCDVYISTWNTSNQLLDKELYKSFDVNEILIKKHIPNAIIDIVDSKINYELNNPNKMVFHMKNILNLLRNVDIIYDKILFIRMDLYVEINHEKEFKYLHDLNETNIIYGCGCGLTIDKDGKLNLNNDTLLYGDYDNIIKFIKNLPDYIHNIHIDFGTTIKKIGCNFKNDDKILSQVVRPKCIDELITIPYLNQMNLDYIDLLKNI